MRGLTQVQVLEALFRMVTGAITGNPANAFFLEFQVGYPVLASGLKMSGVMNTPYAPRVVDALFDMAFENAVVGNTTTGMFSHKTSLENVFNEIGAGGGGGNYPICKI